MNTRKSLEQQIRGWLPKEPACANPFSAQAGPRLKRRGYVRYVGLFAAVFVADLLVMGVVYRLGLGNNYATFAAATTGVLAMVVASVLFKKPNQNKPITKRERRLAKIIAMTNAGMVCVFLGTYYLINPNIESAEATLGLWIALLLSGFMVNNLLYRKFKKQTGLMEGA
jgi:cobalamin synthase